MIECSECEVEKFELVETFRSISLSSCLHSASSRFQQALMRLVESVSSLRRSLVQNDVVSRRSLSLSLSLSPSLLHRFQNIARYQDGLAFVQSPGLIDQLLRFRLLSLFERCSFLSQSRRSRDSRVRDLQVPRASTAQYASIQFEPIDRTAQRSCGFETNSLETAAR